MSKTKAAPKVAPINDIRSYIAALEAHGVLHRVKAEVDWKFELAHVSKVNEEQGILSRFSPVHSPRRSASPSAWSRTRH